MSTGPTTLPESGVPEHGKARRWLPRLGDARIRSKLALILVVPVAAVIALATARLVDIGQSAYQATTIRSLTQLSTDVSALTQDLHRERMAAAAYLADPASKADTYNLHVRRTDERIAAYDSRLGDVGEVPESVQSRLDVIDDHLATLNSTRQQILDRNRMPVAEAVLRYGVVLADLVSYGETLGQIAGEGATAESLRAVAAFAKAKAATAEEEAVIFSALTAGQLDEEQFSSFLATLTSQQEALLGFSLAASSAQEAVVDRLVAGDAVVLADQVAADVTRSVGQPSGLTAATGARPVGAVNDLMRIAELQLESDLLTLAEQARSDVVEQAILESVLLLITLIVAVVLAVVLARSLNHSLRRLRLGALSVANHDLPEAVRRLRDVGNVGDGAVEEIVREVRDPIRMTNRDEVGEVAAAFNVVHREAVRVAAEQAALRTSISAMFLNLARRSQALVDRMIGELDAIERGEEDPKRLAQLFELDHLATRMRRNDENLLVLAGADSTAPRREDALLVDVLRAAQSEVEAYNRIEFGTVDTDISVAAAAVNDVVRLIAELLDNATRFSPPNTVVVADARRIRDYVLVQVEDRGLGLADDQLDALNRRLSAPPTVDVAAFRLMGLAVVSRLAARYDIRVDLRRNVDGGTVAQVTLPSHIVVLPMTRGRGQSLRRPSQPLAVESGPQSPAPVGHNGWSDQSAPVIPRNSAATLASQLRSTAPPQWANTAEPVGAGQQASAAQQQLPPQRGTGFPAPVQQTGGFPSALRQPVTAAHQSAGHAQQSPGFQTEASAGAPTMAYPTVRPLGERLGETAPASLAGQQQPGSGLPAGPVAGHGAVSAPPATPAPRAEDPREAPIFREMEAVWFRSHGSDSTEIFTMPTAGYPPPASSAPPAQSMAPAAAAPDRAPTAGRTALPVRTPQSAAMSSAPAQPPAAYAPPPAAYAPPPTAYAPPRTAPPATAPPPAAPPSDVPPARQPAARGPSSGGDVWRTAADEGWARATRAAEPTAAGTTRSGLPKRVPQAQLVPGGVETKARETSRRTPDEVRGLLSAYHRGVQRGRSAGVEQHGTTSTKETSG
ncbi:nitrate- and nitrite sensing domain-containing protein [Solwaraspora sp. WMMD1047]|uniref:sensor histidine kinase n=1 Tax=Solwaraspora sp. WMMD1047 TaxID=3016102 RepID=UPI00241729AE|nr:nitrate- and nitrite sensing domain-containing protein [Solwaraspora sp. WMMD1047]MDG4828469.1 nitrate- and nitrite sensing domain-containing protein [Solwaraspora sp. WMMD1047]